MALDKTDKRLVNGAIMGAVLAGVVYIWPGWFGIDGISAAKDKENERRASLKVTGASFSQYYSPMQPAHFGEDGEAITATPDVAPIKDLKNLYDQANAVANQAIRVNKKANRMVFPYWTDIPEGERNPGSYFRYVWETRKSAVIERCRNAFVLLDATDIGFDKIKGNLPDEAKSKEFLRELYITEKIIDLCIQAKLLEEAREKTLNQKSEAFMRILLLDPKDSEPTGPTALTPNPKFDPNEKNPSSAKFRKYNLKTWPNFIQEYPVKIQLICDNNTFIHFMYSVRTQKDPDARFEFRGAEIRDGRTIGHLRIIDDDLNKAAKAGRPTGGKNLRWIDDELNFEVEAGDTLPECKYSVQRVDSHAITMNDERRQPFQITEGQFLVMRQLEILSPSFDDSKSDRSEQAPFKTDMNDVNAKRKWPEKPEQIVATIVAAGMDFFDPAEKPRGLYDHAPATTDVKPTGRGGRGGRIIIQGPKPTMP